MPTTAQPLPPGLYDSHLHTPLCNHAKGHPREYAQAALDKGLAGLCFTDHIPMPQWFDAPWRMRRDQLGEYIAMVEEARSEFAGRLDIRIGLEADYHPGTERYVAQVLEAHPWDYVIGSVHYIGAWGFDNPDLKEEYDWRDLGELYASYYALIGQAARTGLFDSIGHLDLPKKFGHRDPDHKAALNVLDVIAEAGLSLDYNTAGQRKPVAETYPAPDLVAAAQKRGLTFVLGSDAHAPAEVGLGFEGAYAQLQGLGGKIVTYRQRRRWVMDDR